MPSDGSFVCPECDGRSLSIDMRLELGPDFRSDEVCVQIVKCAHCGFVGMAVYEESRRGPLGDESWSHVGYRVSAAVIKQLRAAIRACPRPTDPHCACATHMALRRTNTDDGWSSLLDQTAWESAFPMERS